VETKSVEALVSVGNRYLGRAPSFDVEPAWWAQVEEITARLDELLGVRSLVLRLIHADEAEIGRGGRAVYHVQVDGEPRAGVLDPTPEPGWTEIVEPHPLRSTWAEVDGPRKLIDWAAGILGDSGRGNTGSAVAGVGDARPTQVKTWNLSCLVRFPTTDGGAWAKATSRFLSVDADIIDHVRQYDEALAPAVLGIDLDSRWSLLKHAPGIDCWQPDRVTVQEVVSRWVAVQAAIAGEADTLRAPRIVPRQLPDELERLLAGEIGERLAADEVGEARRLVHALPRIVAELDSSGLPITLVHGDFHPGNWRSDGRHRVIVDWADSYVGHPAADIQRLRDWLPAQKRDHAIATWAAGWRRHLPDSEPLRALQPMAVIARLLNAVTYQRFLDNIETSERIYHEDDPTYEVRAALAAWRVIETVTGT
jgi:hypothetical protein